MTDTITLAFDDRVRERDLDHFLIEELQADATLRNWMTSQIAHAFDVPDGSTARVMKSSARVTDGRQTDVRIEYRDAAGDIRAVVLVENKITDGFQLGQAESYAAEVRELRMTMGARHVAAILIAPESNPLSRGDAYFDATLTVEQLAGHLRNRLEDSAVPAELRIRIGVRVELLDALCGKRSGARWVPTTIEAKRDFATAYVELAREILPGLTVRPSTDGPKAVTRFFDGFPGQFRMPVKVRLKHEFGGRASKKYANLQFDGAGDALANLTSRPGLLPADGSITALRSGTSLMIRIATPSITPDPERFEAQRSALIEGLQAVGRLAAWMGQHQSGVAAVLSSR